MKRKRTKESIDISDLVKNTEENLLQRSTFLGAGDYDTKVAN